jgi:hypothetical protein
LKKLTISALVIGSLVFAPTFASAATKAPKPSISGGAAAEEGTAAHESGESAGTQNKEAKKSGVKKTKKVIKKKK